MSATTVAYELAANSELVETPSQRLRLSKKEATLSPDIEWTNLNFRAGKKVILDNCWGRVPSGKVCALMGPSGAGKSSLLNVLAGRSASAPGVKIDGKITVGGKIINPVTFRKNIAYVMQDDALLATATPREALHFSATMRLPSSVTKEEITNRVNNLLEQLGIMVCADVFIGGALIKGISGGQRKRTSVGVELITEPYVLFLDEPTSGLDSYTSFNLIKLLKSVASTDCTMICTIHQPSSEVFFLFDSVIFLKDGQVFYQGPIDKAAAYFKTFGYHIPLNYNPADFIMSLTQTQSAQETADKNMYMKPPLDLLEDGKVSQRLDGDANFTVERSFVTQMVALTKREAEKTIRDKGALLGRYGSTIFLHLLFGLVFYRAGSKDYGDDTKFNAHFGAMTMVFISTMFTSAQPILLGLPYEKPLFLREYSTSTYGAAAYYLSKLIIELPVGFSQIVMSFALSYNLIDLQGKFIYIVLAGFALNLSAASVAVLLASVTNDVKQAQEFTPLLFVPQLLFVGFFTPINKVPIYLRWAQYLCGLKYAFDLLLLAEFHPSSSKCKTSAEALNNCQNILSTNQVHESDIYLYVILLFALFLGFRLMGGWVLVQKAKRFY